MTQTARFVPFVPYDRPCAPSDVDKAKAEAFVLANYDRSPKPYCPVWLADHRDSLLASFARNFMQQRNALRSPRPPGPPEMTPRVHARRARGYIVAALSSPSGMGFMVLLAALVILS